MSETVARTMPDTDDAGGNEEPLRFTGNWFIDAGIIGFVNLMEEVYGWDLQELQEQICDMSREELLSRFAYAFWYKIIKDTTERWLSKDIFKNKELEQKEINPQKLKEDLKKNILTEIQQKNKEFRVSTTNFEDSKTAILSLNLFVKDLLNTRFSGYKDHLKKTFRQSKETLLDRTKSIGLISYNDFFTNLSIFNASSNRSGNEETILANFKRLVWDKYVRKDKKIKGLPVSILDKCLSPFIYSASDFHNEYYGRPLTIETLETILPTEPLIYLLSVPFSFIRVSGKNYFFYTPNIKFTYLVSKKIRYYVRQNNNSLDKSIFGITWNAILDTLVEYKSEYSLESMYLLEFSSIQNQQIQNVEYISIPRLQAVFLLDDNIRNNINTKLEIDKKHKVQKYLIEEFVKGQPLTPIVIKNIRLSLSEKERKIKIPIRTAITASALDLAYTSSNDLFSENSLDRNFLYRNVEYVKKIISEAHSLRIAVSDTVQTNGRLKEGLALRLLDLALKENKYEAVNTALRVIIAHTKECDMAKLKRIINPLLKAINDNAPTWRVFIIAFSLGLLGGNQNA